MIDSLAKEMKLSREKYDQFLKIQEEGLQHLREDLEDKSTFSSSEHIENKVLTITYEHPSSEYHFKIKSQSKISLSGQSFEKQEEELIVFN